MLLNVSIATVNGGIKIVISFSEPEVRDLLTETGAVYTFRKHRRKQFLKQPREDQLRRRGIPDWATTARTRPKLADVTIYEVGAFKVPELRPYSDMSGFASYGGWVEAIKRQFRSKKLDKGWLYKVTLRESTA